MNSRSHLVMSNALTFGLAALFAAPAVFVALALLIPDRVVADDPLELVTMRYGPHADKQTLVVLRNPSKADYTACEVVFDEVPQVVPVGTLSAGEVASVSVEPWVDVSRLLLRCAEGVAVRSWVPPIPQH